ncbi:hypothetical protein ACQPXM_09170 [Kribbella sp. CA-253562]|uniref:hypothetical protein n=1 Tax=Kribbella sp. CA-253562 TaxID=3239942 RepID=UPI003D8D0278
MRPAAEAASSSAVCEHVRTTLPGNWTVAAGSSATYPIADVCSLTNSTDANNRFDISVGVLALSAPDIAALRTYENRSLKDLGYAVRPVAATVSQNSWSVTPAAVGPWIVFFTGGRPVRVAQTSSAQGQQQAVTAVARTIAAMPGGIPPAPAIQARPECERGTPAAKKILGGRAVARRDAIVDGNLRCHWGSTRAGVATAGGGPASEPATDFAMVKDAGTPGSAAITQRVNVGEEGWQQDNGFLAFRATADTFVTIRSVPMTPTQSAQIRTLGKAILPSYKR